MSIVGGEILGATSFARGGTASAAMIELLGEAGVVAQSISATYVIAYRTIDVEATAVGSTPTLFTKNAVAGSVETKAVVDGSFIVKRRVVPDTFEAVADTADVAWVMSLRPSSSINAVVAHEADFAVKRHFTASREASASGTGNSVIHVPVDVVGSAEAAVSSSAVIWKSLTGVTAESKAESSGGYVLKLSLVSDIVPESVFSSAFIVEVSNTPTPDERVMVVPEESRRMESVAMAYLGTFKKQPAETLDYEIDFSTFLPAGDDIAGEPTVLIEPSGLTQVGPTLVTGQEVKLWFSGGTNGTTYKITVTATTDAGRVKQNEFKIKVKDI